MKIIKNGLKKITNTKNNENVIIFKINDNGD